MTDITQRQFNDLRMEVERLSADLASYQNDTETTENRIIDAEFEAQRLHADNERIHNDLEVYQGEIDRLRADNAAMLAALKQIAGGLYNIGVERQIALAAIARAEDRNV